MSFQRYLIIGTLSIVGPIGVAINVLIIAALIKSKLYRSRNYLIYTSLAVSDALNAGIGSTFALTVFATGEFTFCKCLLVETVLAYTTSVAIVAFLSYDRYLMLRRPLHYARVMTRRVTLLILVIIWCVSLLNAGLLVSREAILPITDHISVLNRRNCVMTRIVVREYLISWVMILIIAPMSATIILNVCILQIASAHYKQINRTLNSVKRENSNSTNSSSSSSSSRDWNIKAAYTTVRIVTTNVLCTVPFVCVALIETLCGYCISYKSMKPAYALFLLNFCSPIVNPLVYTITNQELKRHVKRTLMILFPTCLCRRIESRAMVKGRGTMAARKSVTEIATIHCD